MSYYYSTILYVSCILILLLGATAYVPSTAASRRLIHKLNLAGFGKVAVNTNTAKKPEPKAAEKCACGSGSTYGDCCGKYHSSPDSPIDTPIALIRARFSAYVYCKIPFLLASTHPESKEYCLDEEVVGSKRTKRSIWAKQLEARSLETDFTNLAFSDETEAASAQVNDSGFADVNIVLERKPVAVLKYDKIGEKITVKKTENGGFLHISGRTEVIDLSNPVKKKTSIRQMN